MSRIVISSFFTLFAVYLFESNVCGVKIDENGYIVYCPCMGRFGNQAEQLLGSLLFAKHLNRTLVLPPFIEYNKFEVDFVPFDAYFNVETVAQFHRVVTMEKFVEKLAPVIWKRGNRVIMCYKSRSSQEEGCNPFEGNPFKPFWYHFNITTFESSEFHYPLVTSFHQAKEWIDRYNYHPVLAFVGAPSAFPTAEEAIPIAEYIEFSNYVKKVALDYRELREFNRMPYLAVHLRHGSDWIQACDLLKKNEMSQLFSSQQCTANIQQGSTQKLPYELCNPSSRTIVKDIKEALRNDANTHEIKTIYVSTDFDNKKLWKKLNQELENITLITPSTTYGNKVISGFTPPPYIVDVYLMVYSNFFVGNCVSSFSAFVSRLRTFNLYFRHLTRYFAEMHLYENYNFVKDEL